MRRAAREKAKGESGSDGAGDEATSHTYRLLGGVLVCAVEVDRPNPVHLGHTSLDLIQQEKSVQFTGK